MIGASTPPSTAVRSPAGPSFIRLLTIAALGFGVAHAVSYWREARIPDAVHCAQRARSYLEGLRTVNRTVRLAQLQWVGPRWRCLMVVQFTAAPSAGLRADSGGDDLLIIDPIRGKSLFFLDRSSISIPPPVRSSDTHAL